MSKAHSTLTQQQLKETLSYDENTGQFRWIAKRRGIIPGSIAGSKQKKGYIAISVNLVDYYAHRLAWLYVYGEFPKDQIDHINGDKADNRIANLRESSDSENQQNHSTKNGTLGTTLVKSVGMWAAQIKHNGTRYYLGIFRSRQEAHEAYLKAKRKLHTFNPIPRPSAQ